MGQSYIIVNITKKEFLSAFPFGDFTKLMEFGLSGMGTMAGLAILLADGNGDNGGDIKTDPVSGIVGRWAGDSIIIAGEYADKKGQPLNLYKTAKAPKSPYTDISFDVIFALMADDYVCQEYIKNEDLDQEIIKEFNAIHKQLQKNSKNMVLLVGRIKRPQGRAILEKCLKLK
jgi:hypothetical protein